MVFMQSYYKALELMGKYKNMPFSEILKEKEGDKLDAFFTTRDSNNNLVKAELVLTTNESNYRLSLKYAGGLIYLVYDDWFYGTMEPFKDKENFLNFYYDNFTCLERN